MAFKQIIFFKHRAVSGSQIAALLLVFSFLMALPAISAASAPVISEINVYRKEKGFFFSAVLQDGITKEIKELIVSGAPVPFRYYITLKMKRKGWIDKTVGRLTVVKAVKYDLFKKVYKTSEIIKRRGKVYPDATGKGIRLSENRSMGNLKEAISWISQLRHEFLLKSDGMKPSGEYYIQVRADLRTINLWVPFNYILFFLSFWDVETDWAVSSTFSIDTLIAQ